MTRLSRLKSGGFQLLEPAVASGRLGAPHGGFVRHTERGVPCLVVLALRSPKGNRKQAFHVCQTRTSGGASVCTTSLCGARIIFANVKNTRSAKNAAS